MARPPITPERMLGEPDKNRIIYRSDAVHPRHQANFRVFDPLDFLAEISTHIPDAHEKTTLFYGWYSNRTRGYRKQQGLLGNAEVGTAIAEERGPLEIRRSWARLIRQVYEVDPLVCPHCGGTMKIIAVIERLAVIRQILAHLGLPSSAPSLGSPPDPVGGHAADPPRALSSETILADLPLPDPLLGSPGPRGRSVAAPPHAGPYSSVFRRICA